MESKIISFVNKYYPMAREVERKTGFSAVFILAQAALESNWGRSAPRNNLFGIKAVKSTPENQKQLLTTTEILADDKQGARFPEVLKIMKEGKLFRYTIKDWFMAYSTAEDSFKALTDFYLKYRRYANVVANKNDPYKMAEEVGKAGYATAPTYSDSLKSVIKTIQTHIT